MMMTSVVLLALLTQTAEERATAYVETNRVTEHHEVLTDMLGEWTAVQRVFIPDRSPAESEASATCQSLYGGRFVFLETTGLSMGREVQVATILGYDVYKAQYVAVALGENGTAMYTSRGQYDDATRTLELEGEMDDAFGKRPVRYTFHFDNENRIVFDVYDSDEGRERHVVQIDYRRKGTAR